MVGGLTVMGDTLGTGILGFKDHQYGRNARIVESRNKTKSNSSETNKNCGKYPTKFFTNTLVLRSAHTRLIILQLIPSSPLTCYPFRSVLSGSLIQEQ